MYSILTFVAFVVIPFTCGIEWNGNDWALRCEFKGNELTTVDTTRQECRSRCVSTPGCTHYTWAVKSTSHFGNRNFGYCSMKQNVVSKSDAVPMDRYSECGIVHFMSKGYATTYWDCCKPSCAWSGKARVTKPVFSCSRDGSTTLNDSTVESGCNGGDAFTCNHYEPLVKNHRLSYGFATARLAGQTNLCCKCFKLMFTANELYGKQMIIQVTNADEDSTDENRFDIQVPGTEVGTTATVGDNIDGCSAQWGDSDQYDVVDNEKECKKLSWKIKGGCSWRFQWYRNAESPTLNFIEARCPDDLTALTGCVAK